VRIRSLLTYHYLQLSAIKLHPRCIRMIHWKTKLYNHWVSLEAWTTPKVWWTFGGTTILSQAGIPAFRYNHKVHVVRTTTPLRLTIFKFCLWSFSFLLSSHDRSSLPFAVTEGGLGMCCRGYHLATTHQSHHSFRVFSWPHHQICPNHIYEYIIILTIDTTWRRYDVVSCGHCVGVLAIQCCLISHWTRYIRRY